jgi:hypothetical protein
MDILNRNNHRTIASHKFWSLTNSNFSKPRKINESQIHNCNDRKCYNAPKLEVNKQYKKIENKGQIQYRYPINEREDPIITDKLKVNYSTISKQQIFEIHEWRYMTV